MLRLTRWTIAHRRLVAIGWVALAVGVTAISTSVGTRTANNFSLPNTGSQRATDLLASRFPAQQDPTIPVVQQLWTDIAALQISYGRRLATMWLSRRPGPGRLEWLHLRSGEPWWTR